MPIRLEALDLEHGPSCPPAPVRYPAIRLLVRRGGAPLGYLDVANREPGLERRSLAAVLAGAFSHRLVQPPPKLQSREAGQAVAPLVSVVVCTRDRPAGLDRCLAALATQDYPRYEVIVVDNAPTTDATRRVAQARGVHHVVEPTPGLDWARNRGLAAARGEIVAYTDDDVRPDPHWISALAEGFTSPGVAAVTGFVAPAELETRAQLLFEDVYGGMGKGFFPCLHTRRGRRLTYLPQEYGAGCNMAFRRAALLRIGGFDPSLDVGTPSGGGGDLDAFQRVIESDATIAYRPDAIVFHLHRRTVRGLRRQLFDNGRGFAAMQLAALLRARGLDRLRVVYWSLRWLATWHLGRIVRKLRRREQLPLRLILVETLGMLVGPACFVISRRRARRLAAARE